MRDIEFRIYDKVLKESHIEELEDLHEGDIWYDGETEIWNVLYDCNHEQERFVALQYTGLRDKNGIEIYEGDRVYIIPEDEEGVIEWDSDSAKFIVVYGDLVTDFDNWYGADLEVVGDVYDDRYKQNNS